MAFTMNLTVLAVIKNLTIRSCFPSPSEVQGVTCLGAFKRVSAPGWKFVTSPDQAPNQEVHLGHFKPRCHLSGTAQALHLRRELHPARFARKRERRRSPSPPTTRSTVTGGAWHRSLSIPAQMAQLNLPGGWTPRTSACSRAVPSTAVSCPIYSLPPRRPHSIRGPLGTNVAPPSGVPSLAGQLGLN